MKVVVFTLGCKVNECESDSIITALKNKGYEVSDKLEYADIYIVNTCAVTKEAEKKSRQTASRITAINKNARIIYTGCASQKNPEQFLSKTNATLITGVFGKNKLAEMIEKSGVCMSETTSEYEDFAPSDTLRTRTFIKVQDGCDNFCSYCIIPYLRGRNRSRDPKSIVNEINILNPKEAVINGINLSAYNYHGQTLSDLIKRLSAVDCRIRLGSLEVRVITDEFLENLKNLKNFAPHFHLSLQSGSDAVLKKMNRKYTAKEYAEKVDLIRRYFPDAGITTDIIVGFPTETEENFQETLELVKRVKFSDIHPFIFSPREGTVAYTMPDLSADIKKERLNRLLSEKENCKAEFFEKNRGRILDFLYEETVNCFAEGYAGNYLRLYIKDFTDNGKIRKVIVKERYKDGAIASVIE
ncbi:MAG: tRNA (N(6)-L-threonylcarbamoyladenosine(37)-C(2))-methylthiotransferase MtaB [Clostridia bacterium]|nr:tRNA (N(6)-L-threonylcarbamoyladenosine(37)-C(2))-methylthiotransferase MtaB [Clostridia bacterium]